MQHLLYDSDDFAVINATLPPYPTQAAQVQRGPGETPRSGGANGEKNPVMGFLMSHHNHILAKAEEALRPQEIHRIGFEIVDKRTGQEVFLEGAWAEIFQEKLNQYRGRMVTASEFESLIESYSALATYPIHTH